jgi:diguanylate cyclase (GGDEF)-like protein
MHVAAWVAGDLRRPAHWSALMRASPQSLDADTVFAVLERKRMLDAAWIVCWVSLLAAPAVPWFLNVLAIDLGKVAWFVFTSAVVYLVVARLTDRLSHRISVLAAMRIVPLLSIVLMGPLWHLVGGLANPVFLIAFVLPVIVTSSTTMSRQAHASAFLSIVVVVSMALAESPELRWYLAGGTPWIWTSLEATSKVLPARADVFPEVRTSPAYQFTILTTFSVTQLLVAFLATPVAALLRRLDCRIQVSQQMLNEAQGLFQAVLSGEPDPSVIVYADSYQIMQASDSFFKRMLVRPKDILGKRLFDIVQFDQPESIVDALSAPSGEIPFSVYRLHDELRIANVCFHRTEHKGMEYIYVGWQELTELYYLQAGFDVIDDPLIVIGSDLRLRYSNRTAREVFGELHFGMHVDATSTLGGLLEERSAPTETDDDRGHQVIEGRPYNVQQLSARLPGEAGTCVIVWLHCVTKEAALFEQAVRDPLTGIYNRRYFNDAIARHVAKSKGGRQLACAYFDLDHFKTINDQLGHAAGDTALLAFVSAVKSQLRAVDVFARLGGDEFAVLFVNCDLQVAAAAIGRIRTTLDTEGWSHNGERQHLGFSSGIAACHPDDDVDRLLERTDKAVYAAKAGGKGRSAVEE